MSEPGRAGREAGSGGQAQPQSRSRSKTVKPGRLPVSEATSDRAGAGSPFGDDITFPLPPHQLSYDHPGRE